VSILYDWSGIDTTGDSWTLFVECSLGANPENGLLQVDDGSESNFVTRYTCDQNTDTTYSSYALTAGELDGGAPAMRLIDASGGVGDTLQSTWLLDLIMIRRDYTIADGGGGGTASNLKAECSYNPLTLTLNCKDVTHWSPSSTVHKVCMAVEDGDLVCTAPGGTVTIPTGDSFGYFGMVPHRVYHRAYLGFGFIERWHSMECDNLPRLILLLVFLILMIALVETGRRKRKP
jgi:hypothetical protein